MVQTGRKEGKQNEEESRVKRQERGETKRDSRLAETLHGIPKPSGGEPHPTNP